MTKISLLVMASHTPLPVYFGLMSLLAFAFWRADKSRARAGQWRVAERILLGLALLGGAFGALAGMLLFHHKTRKPLFCLVVGAACILQALLLVLLRPAG